MKIAGLTCTKGRFSYLRRVLSCFLSQQYDDKLLLIYNNASIPIKMDPIENVKLINNNIDYVTKQPYSDVGSIFRDALTHIPADVDYVSIMDDDDIYLPRHFSRAAEFFSADKAGYKVWKPGYYFFKRSLLDVEYLHSNNNLEASCIIDHSFLKKHGFEINASVTYNLRWLNAARRENLVFLDSKNIEPSYCYEFSQGDLTHVSHISDTFSKEQFDQRVNETSDFGKDESLIPWPPDQLQKFFDLYFDLDNYI